MDQRSRAGAVSSIVSKGDAFLVLSRLADGDKKKANDVVGALLPTAPCCFPD